MFTGIVAAVGEVVAIEKGALWIRSTLLAGAALGASVAIDGVCLTVAALGDGTVRFDVSPETIERSTLGAKQPGHRVNLERPLTAGDELGGHIVQGHVDGVGEVESMGSGEDGTRLRVRMPAELSRYVVEKGSITIDGVSLTVTDVDGDELGVALVPHTLELTTLGEAHAGRRVNLEVDVLAKYVERLIGPYPAARRTTLFREEI